MERLVFPSRDREAPAADAAGLAIRVAATADATAGPSPGDAQGHRLAAPASPPVHRHLVLGRVWLSLSTCVQPAQPQPTGPGTGLSDITATLRPAPPSTAESVMSHTACVWLPLPSFPGGPTCLLASHLALPGRTSPDLTISSREDSSAPAGTPCSMKPDWHPTWRKHLDAGMRNRCPDRPRAGMVSVGGE